MRPIWLSRNFGQHPATLAGHGLERRRLDRHPRRGRPARPRRHRRASSTSALAEHAQLVYAEPTNEPPHGALRNLASQGAKWLFASFLAGGAVQTFQSYRLILGELGRSVAAYAGAGVYLDVALGWVVDRIAHVARSSCARRAVAPRATACVDCSPTSGGWSCRAAPAACASSAASAWRSVSPASSSPSTSSSRSASVAHTPQGWTSTWSCVLLGTGAILFSLGIIAEYIGVAVSMAMGKPPYLIISDPGNGPLGRRPGSRSITR